MNDDLVRLIMANIGRPLTSDLASDICVLADRLTTLVPTHIVDNIQPAECNGFNFAVERMEDISEEVKPLHLAHWNETEAHRHALPFNPDYATFIRYERAGRYILFTLRSEGQLLGNCAMYLDRSAHTQTLIATEDTLYLLPEARRGRMASRFVCYVENGLRQLGAREIYITVKTVNKAGRFFKMLGYLHTDNGLIKVLED